MARAFPDRALLYTAEHNGMPLKLLRSVTDVTTCSGILFSKLKAQLARLAGKSSRSWAWSKPNTDDMREAQAVI